MATNSVLYKTSSVTLDWADVTGANLYHLQVSVGNPDFSGVLECEDSALAASTKAFTDDGTDETKRYWRWRYSTDGGTTWSEWSEVGSYWMDTTATAEITLAADAWALLDPDAVSDKYTFGTFPLYSIVNENIDRGKVRNRLGTLMSEYVTTKARIELNFPGYILWEQYCAFRRFNEVVKTFFLACYKSNETDNVQHIWKVEFDVDPTMTMLSSGRPGLMEGSVSMIEV